MNIIDGRALAEQVKDGVAQEIFALGGPRPNLAIILAGNRPDSELYVRLKTTEAAKCGIDTHIYRLDETATQTELNETIKFLNRDEQIDGILVQLPLPAGLNADEAIKLIEPDKDVDGFTPDNIKCLCDLDRPDRLMPPVYLAVLMCVTGIGEEIDGRQAAIVAKPGIFAEQLKRLLTAMGAVVEIFPPETDHLPAKTNQADILISAVGQAGLIRSEHIKKGAIVIDIGINHTDKGVKGDVNFDDTEEGGWLTPVPGGIGPLTVAFALKNTLACFHLLRKQKQNIK